MSDIQKISEVSNELLHRKEVSVRMPYLNKITPKKDDAVKALGEFMKVEAERIFLNKIAPVFGKQEAIVTFRVYDSAEGLKKIEARNKKPKKKAEAAAPAKQ